MATMVDLVLMSDKQAKAHKKKLSQPIKKQISLIGKKIWRINKLRLYDGKIISEEKDGIVEVEAQDRNINDKFPMFRKKIELNKLTYEK